MDEIAILIPCYNEEKTIKNVIVGFKKALPEATIYVYDNNSNDKTVQIALENGAILRHEYLQGKGNVIRRMFQEIDAKCYIMVDGDDTYPPDSAKAMAERVLHHQADMVVGDRLSSTYYKQNKRPFHNLGNALVLSLINRLFKSNVKDIMTGYRAFSYRFVKTFPVLSKNFEIETEMTIHAIDKNMQIENVIVDYRDRPAGSVSKLNTFSDGFKVVKTIGRLFRDYKPFSFFGIISLVLFAISIGFFIPVLVEFIQTGLVSKIPTLVCCGFLGVAALFSFFAGSILQSLREKNRQDFEMNLLRVSQEYNKIK